MSHQFKLKPKITDRVRKAEPYSVCDIEVRNWTRFLVIGHYDGVVFKYFKRLLKYFKFVFDEPAIESYLAGNHRMAMRPTGKWLITKKGMKRSVFAHFGGKFDFMFLLDQLIFDSGYYVKDIIPRGSLILCFTVVKRAVKDEDGYIIEPRKEITFRDSSALLPFALRSLCENFKVAHPKLDIDYTKIKKVNKKLIKYLKHDCMGLYEVLHKFFDWDLVRRAGPAYTIAGQALKVWKLFLPKTVYSLSDEEDVFVREAYFGGRTEIFRPVAESSEAEPLYCADVNSLYPTVMALNDFPIGGRYFTDEYEPDSLGVYDAEVEVPSGMFVPPLGVIHEIKGRKIVDGKEVVTKNEKLIFPTGRFNGRWTTMELEYAKSLGVKILSTGKGLVFANGGKVFKEYIHTLYKLREKSDKQSVDNVLTKLLMNSCYGRTGIVKQRENVVLDRGQVDVELFMKLSRGNRNVRLVKEPKIIKTFSNVAIACWVTAASRIYMHKLYLKLGDDLYYTDTDSIFTKTPFEDTTGLGGLKKEDTFTEGAVFLLPKTYIAGGVKDNIKKENITRDMTVEELGEYFYDDMEKGQEIADLNGFERDEVVLAGTKVKYFMYNKIVMKGFDRKKIRYFSMDDFYSAFNGDLKRLKIIQNPRFCTFKTAMMLNRTGKKEKGKPLEFSRGLVRMTPEQEREIRSFYDKREVYQNENGYMTRPLHIT